MGRGQGGINMDYNLMADSFDVYKEKDVTSWVLGYRNVIKYLVPLSNKRILDYGCGTGKFSMFLRDRGAKVIGVDVAERMIDLAKNHDSKDVQYFTIRSGELDFIESFSLDYAVCNFVLCTLSSEAEIVKVLKEVNRVLRRDGLLVILNVNVERCTGKEFISLKVDNVNNLTSGQKIGITLKSKKPLRVIDYFWSQEDYADMLAEADFKIYATQEPVATDRDHEWIDEGQCSPLLIIVAKK
jgi:ubiquinone/menaquinone biosynthesis C-methylase UbiE